MWAANRTPPSEPQHQPQRGVEAEREGSRQKGGDQTDQSGASGDQGSSMMRSLSDADALLVVPVGVGDAAVGTSLTAIELT